MNRIFILILLFAGTHASAYDILSMDQIVQLDKLDLEYNKLDSKTRDPYAPEYTGRWKDRTAMEWDLSVLRFGYWNNWIHTESVDTGTPKAVGWKWEAGVHLGSYLDVYESHHSRHIMEGEEPDQFPIENSYGIRLHLIRGDK